MPPLACLLTWTTYGTWFRGDPRGSVVAVNRWGTPFAAPDADRVAGDMARLADPPLILTADARRAVESAVRDVCGHRGWTLHAVNARSNHIHVVVAGLHTPEKIMTDLKAWSTRRLREAGVVSADRRVWTKHGSTRYLFEQSSVERAADYVVRMQDMKRAARHSGEMSEPRKPGADA